MEGRVKRGSCSVPPRRCTGFLVLPVVLLGVGWLSSGSCDDIVVELVKWKRQTEAGDASSSRGAARAILVFTTENHEAMHSGVNTA